MKHILSLFYFNLVLVHKHSFADILEPPINPNGNLWALLVAGSYGWNNYRHQADICHAYQLLHNSGIPDTNIIVMMYDDIAFHEKNPTPGKIINYPNGPDVYKGMLKDYTGKDVHSQIFYAVLTGQRSMTDVIGSGKVIQSGPNDVVFVNFVGHGGLGVLSLPEDNIFADKFVETIEYMYEKSRYAKMIIYIETGLPNTIFGDLLQMAKNVFVLTAANSPLNREGIFYDELRKTYLSSTFSFAWMNSIDIEISREGKLLQLYPNPLKMTSQVEKYSDLDIGDTRLKDILEYKKKLMKKEGSSKLDSTNLNEKRPFEDALCYANESQILLLNTLMAIEDKQELDKEKLKTDEKIMEHNIIDRKFDRLISIASHNISERRSELENSKYELTKNNFHCYRTLYSDISYHVINFFENPYGHVHLQKLVNMCSVKWFNIDELLDSFKSTRAPRKKRQNRVYRLDDSRYQPIFCPDQEHFSRCAEKLRLTTIPTHQVQEMSVAKRNLWTTPRVELHCPFSKCPKTITN